MRIKQQKRVQANMQATSIVSGELDVDKTSIVAYQNHLLSQMEDIKIKVRYQSWFKQDKDAQTCQQASGLPIKLESGLKNYLSAIFQNQIESCINRKIYDEAFEEIMVLIHQKMLQIIDKFSPQQAQFYNRVVAFNESIKNCFYLQKKQSLPVQTTYSLLKMDVLFLVLWWNEEFYMAYEEYKIKRIIPRASIMRIFNLLEDEYLHFYCMYQHMLQFTHQDFKNEFQQIFSILSFVELKHKISGYYSNNTKEKRQLNKQQNFPKRLHKAEVIKPRKAVQFKFCQYAYLHAYLWPIQKTNRILQSFIIRKLLQISKINDRRTSNEKLLMVRIKFNTNLRQICSILEKIKDELRMTELTSQLQHILKDYQWKYLVQYRQTLQMKSIFKDRYSDFEMIGNYFIFKILNKHLFQRYRQAIDIGKRFKELLYYQKEKKRESIFINYFIYSHKESKANISECTYIMAVKDTQTFFNVLIPKRITEDGYIKLILNFFKKFAIKSKICYNIFVYSGHYNGLVQDSITKLINNCRIIKTSYVFLLPTKVSFSKHFAVNEIIANRLRLYSGIISSKNFYLTLKMLLLCLKQKHMKKHPRKNIQSSLSIEINRRLIIS